MEKDGRVYLKRLAPLEEPTSREGISPKGDGWLMDELPDMCYVCGGELEDKYRLTNKCDKCMKLLDKSGIKE